MSPAPTYDAASLRTVRALAGAFEEVDAVTLASSPVLPRVLPKVLVHLSTEDIVVRVRAKGGLGSARDPHAALVKRVQRLCEEVEQRARWAAEDADAQDAKVALAEANQRRLVGSLVAAGTISEEDAADILATYEARDRRPPAADVGVREQRSLA